MPVVQIPSIILPTFAPTGLEVEAILNLVTHNSIEAPVDYLQEKEIQIVATEVVVAGVPGNLWCWVEISPWPSVNNAMWVAPLPATAVYWAAIGGGGGPLNPATGLPYFPPVAPAILVGTGVNGTMHTLALPWAIHSHYARLVVWTPVAAALPNAGWVVQATFSAGTP